MAIDSEDKMRSIVGTGLRSQMIPPRPDSIPFDQADLLHLARLYRGISVLVFLNYMITVKGENDNIYTETIVPKGIIITRSDGIKPHITSAKIAVYRAIDDSTIIAETDAIIEYSGVQAHIWKSINAGSNSMRAYAIFTFMDGGYIEKYRMEFDIIRG